jgi:hypothetical protein
METNRLLLALAARYNLKVQMMDVKGAYLNGKLDEEIYMKQPEGFTDGTNRVLVTIHCFCSNIAIGNGGHVQMYV